MAKKLNGTIVSAKMMKSVVVAVEVDTKHPIYLKTIKNTRRLKARNEIGAKLGDKVTIEECRPYAKDISWKVTEKMEEK